MYPIAVPTGPTVAATSAVTSFLGTGVSSVAKSKRVTATRTSVLTTALPTQGNSPQG